MRLYQEKDLSALVNLIKNRPAERFADYPGLTDMQEMLGIEDIRAATWIWEDGGTVSGYLIRDEDRLMFEASPGCDLEDDMLAFGIEEVRHAGCESVAASCRGNHPRRLDLLKKYGFTPDADFAVQYERSLLDPIPAPMLPEGFTIRPILGEQEVEAHVAMHRAAWGTENMTVEYRLSMMHTPTYDRLLDLVLVAPDGRLAAYCMCYIDPDENTITGRKVGYTDPLSTHPDFQGRGFAKALLLAGMALLHERGMETAHLGTSSENIPMQLAAEGVDFREVGRTLFFSKPL
jgi:ribosomal protein S18 acetylase RimI-like enzyme